MEKTLSEAPEIVQETTLGGLITARKEELTDIWNLPINPCAILSIHLFYNSENMLETGIVASDRKDMIKYEKIPVPSFSTIARKNLTPH